MRFKTTFFLLLFFVFPVSFVLGIETKGQNLLRISLFPIQTTLTDQEVVDRIYQLYLDRLQQAKRFHVIGQDQVKEILLEYEVALSGLYDFEPGKFDATKLTFSEYFVLPSLNKCEVRFLRSRTTSIYRTNEQGQTVERSWYKERFYQEQFSFQSKLLKTRDNTLAHSDSINHLRETKTRHLIKRVQWTYSERGASRQTQHFDAPSQQSEILRLKNLMIESSLSAIIIRLFQSIPFTGNIIKILGKKAVYVDLGKNQGIKGKYNVKVHPAKNLFAYHPVTGEKVFLNKEFKKAMLKIEAIEDDYSIAKVVRGEVSELSPGQSVEILNKPFYQFELTALNFFVPTAGFWVEKRYGAGAGHLSTLVVGIGLSYLFWHLSQDSVIAQEDNVLDTTDWDRNLRQGQQYQNIKSDRELALILTGVTTGVLHVVLSYLAGRPGKRYNPLAFSFDPTDNNVQIAYRYEYTF